MTAGGRCPERTRRNRSCCGKTRNDSRFAFAKQRTTETLTARTQLTSPLRAHTSASRQRLSLTHRRPSSAQKQQQQQREKWKEFHANMIDESTNALRDEAAAQTPVGKRSARHSETETQGRYSHTGFAYEHCWPQASVAVTNSMCAPHLRDGRPTILAISLVTPFDHLPGQRLLNSAAAHAPAPSIDGDARIRYAGRMASELVGLVVPAEPVSSLPKGAKRRKR